MRTTLTLEDDLARELKKIARQRGESFKALVNETLRHGLRTAEPQQSPLPRFVVEPKACGFRTGIDPSKLNQLVDEQEIEEFRHDLVTGSNPQ